MKTLEVRNLSKIYSGARSVLNNISFSLDDKDFLVVIGKSGCGKSTLLKCIAGLENYQSGDIYLNDENINQVNSKDRNIAMIFQNYYLYPHYTIYQNLAFVLLNQGLNRDEIDYKINEISDKFNIKHLLAERPRTLSGGQRQKVALARVMLKNSNIVLFDEPLANIDEKYRNIFIKELKEHHLKSNIPFIYVTHNQNEALSLASKIMLIEEGRVSSIATSSNMYNNPSNLFSAEFFSKYNFNKFNAKVVDDNHVVLFDRIIEVDLMCNVIKDQDVILGIKGEKLHISDSGVPMRVIYSSMIDDKYLVELQYENNNYYAISKEIHFKDEEVFVDIFNANYIVFDKKFKNRVSNIIDEYYIPIDYKINSDSIDLSFLGTKYKLTKEYLDYLLPFENKVFLKAHEFNFNANYGIKLKGKVMNIINEYIYVLFNDYGIYFKHKNEKIGDEYVIYLDFDSLSFVDNENNILSIACPICDNLDENKRKVNNFSYSTKKEKGYYKIKPIYEELLGNKVVSFFKVHNNIYMDILDKNKTIYSKKKIYVKFIY